VTSTVENREAEIVPFQLTNGFHRDGMLQNNKNTKKNRKGEMRLAGGEREGKRSQTRKTQ